MREKSCDPFDPAMIRLGLAVLGCVFGAGFGLGLLVAAVVLLCR